MSDYPFEKIWEEFLKKDDLEELIHLHIKERIPFLEVVQKYVRSLQERGPVNVLEIGCGTAIDSYYLAEHTKAKIWAIDSSSRAIQVADKVGRYFNSRINLKVADAVKTDFKDSFFNLIFSQGVIEHFKKPIPLMKEQTRLLSEDGYIIIDVPQKYNLYTLFRKMLIKMGRWPYGWERGYSIFELRKLGKQAELKVVEAFARGLSCEFYKSKRPYVALAGRLYNSVMRNFYRIFHKYSVYFLRDICVIFAKDSKKRK